MNTNPDLQPLQQFRQDVYAALPYRRDAIMDLLDAMCSNTTARQVVALSLSPQFRREYGSVFDAIQHFFIPSSLWRATAERQQLAQTLLRITARYLPPPQMRRYWLFGLDEVPIAHPYATHSTGQGYIYAPNPVPGTRPITLGKACSTLAYLPELPQSHAAPWSVPLSLRRVPATRPAREIGQQQLEALLEDDTLPWHSQLCVAAVDAKYGNALFLASLQRHANLVTVARVPGNRVFYHAPAPRPATGPVPLGRAPWYGAPFALRDASTWGLPDATTTFAWVSKHGREYQVAIQAWHNLLMRGKQDASMHEHPFTLVRIQLLDAQGQPVFARALWLVVVGARRQDLSLRDIWDAYHHRFDVEHFFRFGKQHLLLAAYQTPEVGYEENWWQLVGLAQTQLWLARPAAESLPLPWERYLPPAPKGWLSPSAVQRDFARILRQIGTPAQAPKRRGNAPGRVKAAAVPPRIRWHVRKKGRRPPKTPSTTP